jgi:serine/threonine protein phosphatase 1
VSTISTYVISDIHGEYQKFIALLDKIQLKDTDTLYVLGDVLDRGTHPIKTLLKLMEMPNAVCLVGNHEVMALECLEFMQKEITDETIEELDIKTWENILTWQNNGGKTTIDEFRRLDADMRMKVLDFINDLLVYEELTVAGKDFILVHAGLGDFSPGKDMEDYSLYELIWEGADYGMTYFPDKYVVTGHTPTQTIEQNPKPGFIYRKNNHIAIDCGANFPDGRLAAICLDTGEEYYI